MGFNAVPISHSSLVDVMQAREYSLDYKKEAIKLAKEIGVTPASEELKVPKNTLYGWMKKEEKGEIDLGPGTRTPANLLALAEENKRLKEKLKEVEKENEKLRKTNTFLDEASRFFAGSRQK